MNFKEVTGDDDLVTSFYRMEAISLEDSPDPRNEQNKVPRH